jgi:hypothetical protein
VIVVAGCLAMAYTQLTMSPATIEFARELGARGLHIGILGALPTGMYFTQFLAAVAVNHMRFRRRLWFAVGLVQRLIHVPVAVGPLLFPEVSGDAWVWLLVATTAVNHGLINFCTPLWLSWMGDYLPSRGLSRYWGVRHLWMQWASALSLFVAALLLLHSGWEVKVSFAVLIVAGAVLGVADLCCFWKVEEPPVTPAPSPRLRDVFAAPFRNRDYRSFIAYTCFWHLAAMVGAPFISFYLLAYVGMDLYRVLLLWTFSWVGGAVFSRLLGQLAEERGHRPLLVLCTLFKSQNMLALLLLPRDPNTAFWILVPVFMVDAVLNAGIAIASNGFMLKYSPSGGRTMYIAAGMALAGMVGCATSVVSGAALDLAASVRFTLAGLEVANFHLLFAASIALRLAAVPLARRVREPQARGAREVLTLLLGATPLRILRFPLGLYRRYEVEASVTPPDPLPVEDVPRAADASPAGSTAPAGDAVPLRAASPAGLAFNNEP